MQNPAAFTTILSTPHKHMAHSNIIFNTADHIHLHTPTQVDTATVAT